MRPLMIFAAGLGTRMRPLTQTRPKPLIEVGGQTLLDRALHLGRQAGCAPIAVNTHYLGQQIADHLAGQDVAISDEGGAILDTGGGLRKALPLLGSGPVMTLNPDVVWTGPNPLETLAREWRDGMQALLALVPIDRATARQGAGDFARDGAGRIARHGDFVYAGAQIVDPDLLAQCAKAVAYAIDHRTQVDDLAGGRPGEGSGVELAGKTVYYTGKGAVGLVSGGGDSVPVTVADNIDDIEKGRLRLTVRFRDGKQMYSSDRVIPARKLDKELDALMKRDDVVDVFISRP